MAIPTYQDLMTPLLQVLSDGQEHHINDLTEAITKKFDLTDEEISRRLPSGQSTYMQSRVGWARAYLFKSKLIDQAGERGVYKINQRGLDALRDNPRVDNSVLRQYPEFTAWLNKRNIETPEIGSSVTQSVLDIPPDESLAEAYKLLRDQLSAEILEKVKSLPPAFFERLVVELLVKIGYGGTREDAGQAVGQSGDGGIDGIINEDRLGLDVIYLQAKRCEGNVSRLEIQKFAGKKKKKKARKGVFITTSAFTKEARDFAAGIESKIVLIDGDELAELMIDYNLGVSIQNVYEIKRIDSDYFVG